MKQIFAFLLLTACFFSSFGQQDEQYSHNMFNHAVINPGYAGMNGQICATAIQRNQWLGFEGAPKTTNFSIHTPLTIFGQESGVGISIVNDEIGSMQNFKLRGAYSYHYNLGLGKLGIGIDLGIFNNSLNEPDGGWKTPSGTTDENIPVGENSKLKFDMSFGAFYQTDQYYVGLSASHLTSPDVKYDVESGQVSGEGGIKIVPHYFLTAGYTIPLSIPLLEVTPSVFIKSEFKTMQISINTIAVYNKKFWGGVSYRHQDAVIALLGLEYPVTENSGVKIGLAYDITLSKLAKASSNGYEIFLSYCFDLGLDKIPRRYNSIRNL